MHTGFHHLNIYVKHSQFSFYKLKPATEGRGLPNHHSSPQRHLCRWVWCNLSGLLCTNADSAKNMTPFSFSKMPSHHTHPSASCFSHSTFHFWDLLLSRCISLINIFLLTTTAMFFQLFWLGPAVRNIFYIVTQFTLAMCKTETKISPNTYRHCVQCTVVFSILCFTLCHRPLGWFTDPLMVWTVQVLFSPY